VPRMWPFAAPALCCQLLRTPLRPLSHLLSTEGPHGRTLACVLVFMRLCHLFVSQDLIRRLLTVDLKARITVDEVRWKPATPTCDSLCGASLRLGHPSMLCARGVALAFPVPFVVWQALRHPFITSHELSTGHLPTTVTNLRRFNARRKLRVRVSTLSVVHATNP
jgi:hypothetical protein